MALGSRGFTFLFVLAALCPAQDGDPRAKPDPRATFEKGLKTVRKQFERRKWKSARRNLERLLKRNAGQPFVLARRVDIADLMKQCLFREEHGVPKPTDMVRGRLLNYNLATGKIKIRYEIPVPRADFMNRSGVLLHRARFKGPHKIRFASPFGAILLCIDNEELYFVQVGPTKVLVGTLTGSRRKIIERGVLPIPRVSDRDPHRVKKINRALKKLGNLEVRVTRRSIDVYVGAKRVMSAKKPADRWGHWAVGTGMTSGTLTVEGVAEPSWMQGMVDREDQKRLKGFEANYRASKHLPAWLFRRAPEPADRGAGASDTPDERTWPVRLTGSVAIRVRIIDETIAKGTPESALAAIDQAGKDFPPVLRAHVRAKALEELGRFGESLKECESVCERDAEFVPARLQRARLLRRLERMDDAVTVYKELMHRYPGGARLHALAALFFVECGRPDDARRALVGALERGLKSRELRKVNALVTKALNGPSFGQRVEHKSRHYRVVTDIDITTAKRATRLLERAYELYTDTLDKVDDADRRRFTVYLFRGRDGYLKYGRDVFGYASPRSAGMYSLTLKQLLIWNLPERDEMLRTIRHEGFHQYVDRLIQGPPLWFNEGIAEYYEAADLVRGKLKTGRIVKAHIKTLRKVDLAPLPKLLGMQPREFMSNPTRHYAQSWAFIHFLRHTTKERAELFRRFWNAFRKFPSHKKAMLWALRGQSLTDLERDFKRWLGAQ